MGYVRNIEDEAKYRAAAIKRARELSKNLGDIYVDDLEPEVEESASNDGAYVQAWIWIDKKDI